MTNLSYNDVVNSFEFKLTERILKSEFPWIKRIDVNSADLEKYENLIFIEIYIDAYELAKEKDWKINWYQVDKLRNGISFSENFLSILYKISYETAREFTEEVKSFLDDVKKSPAIPIDLKLPKEKHFSIISWITIPNTPIPPDAEEYELEYKPSR